MPNLKQLTAVFFHLGNTTFGGGDPTMSVLGRELQRRGWMTAEQFNLVYGLARITPGTNMMAFCAGAAWILLGSVAAILAVLVVTIPTAALVVCLTKICEVGNQNRWAHAAIAGTVAAAVGIMLAGTLILIRLQVVNRSWLRPAIIVAASFALARTALLSPVQILALAAVAGLIWTRP